MARSDDIIAHAEEFIGRLERSMSPAGRAARQRQRHRRRARARLIARRLVLATAAILAVAVAIGLWAPIGLIGVMAVMLAMAIAWAAILLWSTEGEATPQRIAESDLARLPARTGEWLDRQRALLPPPAQRQIDQLALALETIAPQVAAIDPWLPEAIEVRRLIGDELPDLVRGYQRVPPSLRRVATDGGRSPDGQLVDGLETIGAEIARMNARLAANDLNALAAQNRFLEIKYRGEDGDRVA